MVKKYTGKIYLALCYIFLYMPIIFMMVFSFNESRYTKAFTGFSLKWYMELFKDESIMKVFSNTYHNRNCNYFCTYNRNYRSLVYI